MSDPSALTHTLAESRTAFLAEARARTPTAFRSVDFASILDAIIVWSVRQGDSLRVREPGDQHTVSFGVAVSDVVLWAAYPRREDGAKIVVLPRTYRLLPETGRSRLLTALREVAPTVAICGTGLLQVPMHLLSSDRALGSFGNFLSDALHLAKAAASSDRTKQNSIPDA